MAQVSPEPGELTLRKPFPGTTQTTLDPTYLAQRKACGEQFCNLPDGRVLCYFKLADDSAAQPTLVLAFHGGCEGKYAFMRKDPLPGVLFVALDRPGYGRSTKPPEGYNFVAASKDVLALAKHLGFDKFICTGHSLGGFWSQQLAAALPDNVEGIILWAPACDLGQAVATKADEKAIGRPPACCHPYKGCCGCCLRSDRSPISFTSYAKSNGRHDFERGVQDERKHAPKAYEELIKDPFWVSTKVESWMAFSRPEQALGILKDAEMTIFAGTHGLKAGVNGHQDLTTIKSPVYIYLGDKDVDIGTTYKGSIDYYRRLYPKAEIETLEGYGHSTVFGPNEQTKRRFIKAVAGIQQGGAAARPVQQVMMEDA